MEPRPCKEDSSPEIEDDENIPPVLRRIIDNVAREQVEAERLRLVALRLLGKEGGIELNEETDEMKELLERAEKLFSEKKYPPAIKAYQEIYDQYPEWEYAEHSLMMIGLCYDWLGQLEKEIEIYKKAIKEYPDLKGFIDTTYYYLGFAYYRTGRTDKAIRTLGKCMKLGRDAPDPKKFPHLEAERTIALIQAEGLFKEEKYEEAIEAYRDISVKYPDWHEAESGLFMIGICHQKMGRREEAIEALQLAIKRFPDLKGWTDVTYFHLGILLEEKGETNKALEAYHNSLRLGEGHRDPESFPLKDTKNRIEQLETSAEA